MKDERQPGFTLVELLVLLLVLAVLAVILFPFFRKTREVIPQDPGTNNQRQIVVSLLAYAQDHHDRLPLPSGWVKATGLVKEKKIFDCPTSKYKGTPEHPEYGMNAFLYATDPKTGNKIGLPMGSIPDPGKIELTAEIAGPTGSVSRTMNGRPTNPFPRTYTAIGFGKGGNAALRHQNRIVISYLDGHVAVVDPQKIPAAGRTKYNLPL